MLESDAEGLTASRAQRRKALTLSIALEAAVLSLLIVVPLLFPGVVPNLLSRTPVVPYVHIGDVMNVAAPHAPSVPTTNRTPTLSIRDQQPAHIPSHVYDGALPDAPSSLGTPGSDTPGPTGPGGPGVPFAFGPGAPPELKPPPEKPLQRQKVSEGVMAAALITQVQPIYPEQPRMMHLSGEVVLHAVIGTDGTVRQLKIVSGNPLFAQSALNAVRQWRYHPTLLNNQPVEVDTTITVKFILGTE